MTLHYLYSSSYPLGSFKNSISHYLSRFKTLQTNVCIYKKVYEVLNGVVIVGCSKMSFNF